MTQLIAADMDGTLLDSQKRLSPDLFPLIRTRHPFRCGQRTAVSQPIRDLFRDCRPDAVHRGERRGGL